MIKIFELLPPRQGISVQEFHDHWRHPHGTMARSVRQVRRYFQNHRIESAVLGANPTRFEGVGEGWFDTAEECFALENHPYMIEHLVPDEERFIDRAGIQIMVMEEEVISSGPHAGAGARVSSPVSDYDLLWSDNDRGLAIKVFQVIAKDGQQSWRGDDDAELGHRIGALRHVRSTPVITPAPYVGVRELWWPTQTAFERGVRADPEAWAALCHRPEESFCLLVQAERQI